MRKVKAEITPQLTDVFQFHSKCFLDLYLLCVSLSRQLEIPVCDEMNGDLISWSSPLADRAGEYCFLSGLVVTGCVEEPDPLHSLLFWPMKDLGTCPEKPEDRVTTELFLLLMLLVNETSTAVTDEEDVKCNFTGSFCAKGMGNTDCMS